MKILLSFFIPAVRVFTDFTEKYKNQFMIIIVHIFFLTAKPNFFLDFNLNFGFS